jgi:hypothetical protein
MTMASPIRTKATYLRDLIERIVATFVQAFLAALVAGDWFNVSHLRDLSIVQAAGLSAVAAVLALVKGLVAKGISNKNSASTAPGV